MSSTGIWSHGDPKLVLSLSNTFKADKVNDFLKGFIFTDEDINILKILFDKEIEEGLQRDDKYTPVDASKMTMDVTYFIELFDGTEAGDFVVINLTARNLFLVLVTVKPGFPVRTLRKYFTIDENVRKSPYILIFEYLCDCLLIFCTENNLLKKPQILGFCTDLPLIRSDINNAIISYFTATASDFPLNCYDIQKCFEIVLLKERYKDIEFKLVVIVSVNMSLLIYSSYIYGPIDIFLNLENDCDMIYQEEIGRIMKWGCPEHVANQVFIETKLKNFGRSGTLDFIATSSDWSVISQPLSVTSADTDCRLEKFLSQQYILELIRHTLITLHHELVYCREGDIGSLYNVHSISLSDILTFMGATDVLHATQLLPAGTIAKSSNDALIAKYVCKIVFIRAALLVSICLSRIFLRFQKDDFVVALKCPLLQKYSDFETYIRNFMSVLVPLKKFQFFFLEEDVCMEGAGLATAIGNRMLK